MTNRQTVVTGLLAANLVLANGLAFWRLDDTRDLKDAKALLVE
jgi:hypothetical protein